MRLPALLMSGLNPRFALEKAIETVSALPMRSVDIDPVTGHRGWFMTFGVSGTSPVRREHGPGIYGTSFAMRLLALSPSVQNKDCTSALRDGARFLLSQLSIAGETSERQVRKQAQVGHADADLTLKLAATLDAMTAISCIRNRHVELDQIAGDLQSSICELVRLAVDSAVTVVHPGTSRVMRGWSWWLGPPVPAFSDTHIIPSALMACAVSQPGVPERELVSEIAGSVASYLWMEIEATDNAMMKALAYNAWSMLQRAYDVEPPDGHAIANLQSTIARSAKMASDLAWQELIFYDIPRPLGGGHYRPSLWLSPRMLVLQAAMNVCPQDVRRVCVTTALDITRLLDADRGGIRFLQGQATNLVGNYDAVRYLKNVLGTYFRNRSDIAASCFSIWLDMIGRLSIRFPLVVWIILMAAIWEIVIHPRLESGVPTTLGQSWTLLATTLKLMLSVWPLWAIWLVICLAMVSRPLTWRVTRFLYGLGSTVLVGILASLLTK